MNLRLNFVVNVLTVLLIQVVFSKCDLKTKRYNHFTKSYVDGFQRKERQAPIDPSRMYLPPRIDSVASSGFGGQIAVSNNFGSDNNGYGEVENAQETFAKSPTTDFSNYGQSPKTTDGASDVQSTLGSLYDTSTYTSNRPVGSSLDQSNGHNTSPGGNNFGQLLNKNDDYVSSINLPGTNNNYYSSFGTTSIPTNNGVAAPTATAEGYGQNELLNTAQNQGPIKYNYNKATAASQFGQNPSAGGYQHSQQSTVENTADGYGNVDLISSKDSLQDNYRIGGQNSQRSNGNFDSNRGQPFSLDNSGYANTATNSYGQKYTSGEYSQIENGNKPNTQFSIDISSNPSSIGSVGFPSSVLNIQTKNNLISKSISQSNNDISSGNYRQNKFSNDLGFQAGGNNKEVSSSGYGQYPSESSQGVSAATQSYGQHDFEKPNINSFSSNSKDLPSSGESFSQSLPIKNEFEQSANNEYNQKVLGINKNQVGGTSIIDSQKLNSIGTSNRVQSSEVTYQNSYGQSSLGVQSFNQGQGSLNYMNGFDSNSPSQLQSSNNFGQSESHSIGNKENYGQISPAYNGFNQDQQNYQLPNSYGPPSGPSQSFINGRNPAQSQSNDGYNQGRPSNGRNDFDQRYPSTPQVSNNYGNSEYQPSSLSGNDYEQSGSVPPSSGGYNQGSSSNELNGFGQNRPTLPQGGRLNNYGPPGSQTLSTTRIGFTQNSPTNGAHPQEATQGSTFYGENGVKPNSVNRENIATNQLGGYIQNGLASQGSGQESSRSPPGYGQGTRSCTSKNGGDIGHSKTSTVSPADSSYGIRNQKKHSTLVPKGQFQNSNLPSSGKGVQDVSSNANNNSTNFGEPGYNSFSNFAPGNQPNQPIDPGTNNCDASKRGDSMNEAVFSPTNTGY